MGQTAGGDLSRKRSLAPDLRNKNVVAGRFSSDATPLLQAGRSKSLLLVPVVLLTHLKAGFGKRWRLYFSARGGHQVRVIVLRLFRAIQLPHGQRSYESDAHPQKLFNSPTAVRY